jgi:hypothetical protein
LLDEYARTHDKLQSYILKSESQIEFSLRTLGRKKMIYKHCEVRYDGTQKKGNRVRFSRVMWGRVGTRDVPKDRPVYTIWTWDGNNYMRYSGVPKACFEPYDRPGTVHPYMSGTGEITNGRLTSGMFGTVFTGYIGGTEERFDVALRTARSISVRRRAERTNGVECYIIDSNTDHGKYTIWIDPEHGYNVAKAEMELLKSESHLLDGKPFEGKRLNISVENMRFKRIEGVWLPVEADIRYRGIFNGKGGNVESRTHTKLTEFILNPDHDLLGSFTFGHIPDGSPVKTYVDLNSGFFTAWDPLYLWKTGARLVVDRKGQWVEYESAKGLLPVVKAVPDLRELELNIPPEKTKGKRILLIFCDLTEPASQKCVLELDRLSQSLEQKGILVAALHCSKANSNTSEARVQANRLELAVGTLRDVIPQILRAWRIDELPWLILTDTEGVITAEGFPLDRLAEKLEEMHNAIPRE